MRDGRRVWASLAAGAVLAGATVLTAAPAARPAATTLDRLLPAADTRRVVRDARETTIDETAPREGLRVLVGGPAGLQRAFAGTEELEGRWLRRVLTTTDAEGTVSQAVGLQRVSERGLTSRALAVDGEVLVFEPEIVDLPAEPSDGGAWTSEGTARLASSSRTLPYRYESTSHRADGGCWRVETTGGLGTQRVRTEETWCPGRGVVASSSDGVADTELAAPPGVDVSTREAGWPADQAWAEQRYRSIAWPLESQLRPVQTSDAVVAVGMAHDLMWLVRSGERFAPARWAIPGGRVTALTALGDAVVVATDRRAVLAYDNHARLLWRVDLPDAVRAAPTRLDDGTVVVAGLDGRVTALRLATGERVWTARVPGAVQLPVVVAGGHALVADADGHVTALDPATGRQRWQADAESPDALAAGQAVYVGSSDLVLGLDPDSGDELWTNDLGATVRALASTPAGVVAATAEGLVGLDGDGARSWRQDGPAPETLLARGDRLLVGTDRDTRLLSADGREVARLASSGGDDTSVGPLGAARVDGDELVVWGPR